MTRSGRYRLLIAVAFVELIIASCGYDPCRGAVPLRGRNRCTGTNIQYLPAVVQKSRGTYLSGACTDGGNPNANGLCSDGFCTNGSRPYINKGQYTCY